MNPPTLKQKLGCWWHERWRLEWVLRAPGMARRAGLEWLDLRNRHERLARSSDGRGRICLWSDSSLLTVCRIFPRTGARLLRHVWSTANELPAAPLSIILPVRGSERAPVVAFVMEMVRRQIGSDSEILLCEHDAAPHYAHFATTGIRHVFVPAVTDEPFNKSKAMNAGARAARQPTLVLLDADGVLSPTFLARAMDCLARGWEAVRPLRFLFLLDEPTSHQFVHTGRVDGVQQVAAVQQNTPGMVTVIRRDSYAALGGHDERFAGWGGEDIEFLDRLQTRKLYPGSFLPAIHLWHPPAPQKASGHRNHELMLRIMAEPAAERVARARQVWEPGS